MLQTLVNETTPRRTMFVAGLALILVGIAGLFANWGVNDWIAMTTAKSIVFIVLGLFTEYVAEVWTTEIKRPYDAFCGMAAVVLGVGSLLTNDLGFMRVGNLEGVFYLAIGIPQLLALFWPRRFYDYEWGTGWSSGMKWSSKADVHMTSALDRTQGRP